MAETSTPSIDPLVKMIISQEVSKSHTDLEKEWEESCRDCRHSLGDKLTTIAFETQITAKTVARMEECQKKVLEFMQDQHELPMKVRELQNVVFGKDDEPGIKGHVASLLETRSNVRWGIGLLWGMFVGVIGALVKIIWTKQ